MNESELDHEDCGNVLDLQNVRKQDLGFCFVTVVLFVFCFVLFSSEIRFLSQRSACFCYLSVH